MSMQNLAVEVGKVLQANGVSMATAESCTGGWIAKMMTDIAGSSAWFDCGFVTYSNNAKERMLGVKKASIDLDGAVSESVVREMAEGAIERSSAAIAVAVSGIAGPQGGTPQKPVGTVWLAWSIRGKQTHAQCCHFEGNRDAVRRQTAEKALKGVIEYLVQQGGCN